jgi:hypothetical protein
MTGNNEVGAEAAGAIQQWMALFNAGHYFEAHEVLEAPWLAAEEPVKTFLKGLIHAAVSLHHYQRGNTHGARTKHRSCVRYLDPYQPQWGGLDIASLLRGLEVFLAPLQALPRGEPPPPPAAPWPRVDPLPRDS